MIILLKAYPPSQINTITEIAVKAIREASKVCKKIFQYRRWNCPDFEENLFDYKKNSLGMNITLVYMV